MKITWIGHSCFKIEQNGYAIITDPYEDGYVPGLKPLRETADLVLCSHEHGDHNARSKVKIKEGAACPFKITKIETFHDEVRGAKRGLNTIHIMEAGGIRAAHLGDLGCEPDEEQIRQLEHLDVCMIPVGGFYTIDGRTAADLVHRISPRIVIPMHYRDDEAGFGFDAISTVSSFTDRMESVCAYGSCTISVEDSLPAQVMVLQPRDCK